MSLRRVSHDVVVTPSNNENGLIAPVGAALCGRPLEEPTEGLPYIY